MAPADSDEMFRDDTKHLVVRGYELDTEDQSLWPRDDTGDLDGNLAIWIRGEYMGDVDGLEPLMIAYAKHANELEMYDLITDLYSPLLILPIWMYEHSGQSIRAGKPIEEGDRTFYHLDHNPFSDRWDSSFIGFMFDNQTTRQRTMERNAGLESDGLFAEFLHGCMLTDVEAVDAYLKGDVWALSVLYESQDDTAELIAQHGPVYGESVARALAPSFAYQAFTDYREELRHMDASRA
jgi:hypothetical protein